MAVTATPIYPQALATAVQSYANADGTTIKTILTAGANGTKITAVTISSTDGTNRDMKFYLNDGSTNHLLCTVQVLANSGNTNAIAPVDLFRATMCPGLSFDSNGNRELFLKTGWSFRAGSAVAVTAAAAIAVICTSAGDY
jgi:hypothetical protein